jgi:hypothetical protein
MATSTASAPTALETPETILRGIGAVLLGSIALIHFLDVFDKFEETPYQGWLFIALILGCLAAATQLVRAPSRLVWVLAALCGLAPLVMYIVSRSVGLPGSPDEIGNWTEALGLASLATEACTVVVSAYMLTRAR